MIILRNMKVLILPSIVLLASAVIAADSTNLVRNAGFESGTEGWRLPGSFRLDDTAVHRGMHSLCQTSTNPAAYHLATQDFPFQPGRRYRYSAWIKTREVRGEDSGATLCVEWSGTNGWLGGSYVSGRRGDQDWFFLEGVTGPLPSNAATAAVKLYLRKGMTGTAWYDEVAVTPEYPPPLHVALLQPNYRGTLRLGEDPAELVVRARLGDSLPDDLDPAATALQLDIASGTNRLKQFNFNKLPAGDNDLRLDLAGLPTGDYQVHATLFATAGRTLATQDVPFRVVATDAHRPSVWIDRHNRTLVNGKPFFPLGWYFGPGPTSADAETHIDRIARSPFNTIMCYGINVGDTNRVRAYLDLLARRGVKIIYSIKDVYAGTTHFHEPVLGWRGEETIVRNVVQQFRGHPAILGWYLNDELPLTLQARLEERYRLVASLDPDHPTWAVLYQVDELADYLGTADVLGTDPYPVPSKPVTLAADWTKKTRAASGGCRPVWMVPQAFDWTNYRREGRVPTLAEERVMTYLCLIHGANGLIYYSYADLLRDKLNAFDRRWADMLVVGREVRQLEPALLSVAAAPALDVSAPPAVQYAVRQDDAGRTYLLLANPDSLEAATAQVKVPAGRSATLLRDAKLTELAVGNGQLSIELTPMDAATLILNP